MDESIETPIEAASPEEQSAEVQDPVSDEALEAEPAGTEGGSDSEAKGLTRPARGSGISAREAAAGRRSRWATDRAGSTSRPSRR